MKNIIWDFDGTLYDTNPELLKFVQYTLEDFGVVNIDTGFLNKTMHDLSIDYIFDYYSKDLGVTKKRLNDVFHSYERKYLIKPRTFSGIEKVLSYVTENGGKNVILTHRDSSANRFLEQDNLARFFIGSVTSDDGFARKPDPESSKYIIKKFGLNPFETVMIGDRIIDIDAGRKAEIKTVHYNPNGFYESIDADYSIERLDDLIPLFFI